MSDLEALKNKLAGEITEGSFALEQRTVAELLQYIGEYTAQIPFASDKESVWRDFWLSGYTPQQLAAVYQDTSQAEKKLPVQQAFLLAVLRLLETPKLLLNTLPARHRLLYYRDLLGFTPQHCQPDSVVVSFTLRRNTPAYRLSAGSALNGGQDQAGNKLTYLTDQTLLITPQQLDQICWTRQADDGWKVCTAQDQDKNIALPDDGIRLFSATDNERPRQNLVQLDCRLVALTGELSIEAPGEMVFSLCNPAGHALCFQQAKVGGERSVYRLPATTLAKVRQAQPQAWKMPQLTVQMNPALKVLPASLQVTLRNCQEISYRAQGGEGNLETFSLPFGMQPQAGNAFELTLPGEFLQTGGELCLLPHWHDLPQQSFAQWYAAYPDIPADNGVFSVSIDLLASDGTVLQRTQQSLFSGDGVPQAEPLRITIPADGQASSGGTLRVMLNGADFFCRAWQTDPTGKNPPWIPQVTRFTTLFQAVLADSTFAKSLSRAARAETDRQELYLGFSHVLPGETLSVYWSLHAPAALNLAWFCYNTQGEWVPLAASILDATGGLSVSGLWQVTLPTDCAAGSEYENFSDDYYWIKATEADGNMILAENAARVSAVIAGAVTATLDITTGVDSRHFDQLLPAGAISQLVVPVDEISHVSQLLPSVGGRPPETQTALLKRAATRISHRQRGVSWENMRSLLMDNYPWLYDVQFPDTEKLNHIPALEVQQLMVIPCSRYRDNDDALRPTLSTQRLSDMTRWLMQYCSPWATLSLVNPTYIDVLVRYQALFTAGISPDWGYNQLASWLRQHYMPWGDDQQRAVTPGNKIDYYPLLATLQQSPLVERVTALTLQRAGESIQTQSVIAGENEVLILNPLLSDQNGELYV
ncbi:hypothetical protein ACGVWS_01700 [Enterobacteriaceae bacterium LUAb1]